MIRIQTTLLILLVAVAGCSKSNDPGNAEVSRLLRDLRNGQLEERQAAAEELAKLKSPRAVEQLIISLSEPQPAVRQAAAFALGETGDKRAVPGLIRLLKDKNVDIRKAAIEALAKIGDESATPAIIGCLDDSVLSVRYAVGPACAKLGSTALQPLLNALKDPQPTRRAAAAAALGHVRNPASADALLAALEDDHLQVRQAATEALGVLGDERAVSPLTKLLQEPMRESDLKRFQERIAAPVPEAEANKIAKILRDREGNRRIPAESSIAVLNRKAVAEQKKKNGEKPAQPDFIELQTDELKALVEPPLSESKTAEIVAIITDRIGPERWSEIEPEQQEAAIAKEITQLKVLWTDPQTELKTEKLFQVIALRSGRLWWNGLPEKQRETMIRQEYMRPIQDEQKYSGSEMRRSAAQALARLATPSALQVLYEATSASDREVRDFSQAALASLEPKAIPALTTVVNNDQLPLPMRSQALTSLAMFKDPQLVDAYLNIVNGKEPGLRAKAAQALAKQGDPRAIPPLARILKDGDADSRLTAATTLATLANPECVTALIGALNDSEIKVQCVALDGLGKIGDPRAADPVLAALQKSLKMNPPDDDLRRSSIRAVGNLKDKRAVDLLNPLLNDATKENRDMAGDVATALGRIGDPRAVEPLIAFLQKRIWGPCFNAAAALGEIGDPRAVDVLAANTERKPYPEMPPIAIKSLGKIADTRAADVLINLLRHADGDTRKSAAEALIAAGERVVPRLMQELSNSNADLRGLAAQTLGYIGKPAVEPLLNALKTPPIPEALPAVIYALSMIRDERVTAPLIEAMNHPDPTIRANVAWALGQSENQTALTALKKALEDKDERVRKSAASAIDRVSSALANQQATTTANTTTAVAP